MFELTLEHRKRLLVIAVLGDGVILSHTVSHHFVVELEELIERGYVLHTKKRDAHIFTLTELGWNAILRFAGPKKKSTLYKELKHLKRMHIGQ
jgi:hypothetical protein